MRVERQPDVPGGPVFEPGDMPTLSASMTEPEPPDEVDALFLGDPDSPQTSR